MSSGLIPSAVTGPLPVYLSNDGNLYAADASSGMAHKITSAAPPAAPATPGIPEAPMDGQLYGRQNGVWVVVRSSISDLPVIESIDPDTGVESTQVLLTVTGQNFTDTSHVQFMSYPLATTYVSPTSLKATLNLGPGSAGTYNINVVDMHAVSNAWQFTVAGSGTVVTGVDGGSFKISCTDIGGDLLVTSITGPNSGKKVNLTYGKWT